MHSEARRKNPEIDIRSLSLLAKQPGVETLSVPQADPKSLRPFEVVGIPLAKPGFYVVELASPALGASLLGKPQAMYVRTSVLVTNLGVHFKQGRENSIVWVDRARQRQTRAQRASSRHRLQWRSTGRGEDGRPRHRKDR